VVVVFIVSIWQIKFAQFFVARLTRSGGGLVIYYHMHSTYNKSIPNKDSSSMTNKRTQNSGVKIYQKEIKLVYNLAVIFLMIMTILMIAVLRVVIV